MGTSSKIPQLLPDSRTVGRKVMLNDNLSFLLVLTTSQYRRERLNSKRKMSLTITILRRRVTDMLQRIVDGKLDNIIAMGWWVRYFCFWYSVPLPGYLFTVTPLSNPPSRDTNLNLSYLWPSAHE